MIIHRLSYSVLSPLRRNKKSYILIHNALFGFGFRQPHLHGIEFVGLLQRNPDLNDNNAADHAYAVCQPKVLKSKLRLRNSRIVGEKLPDGNDVSRRSRYQWKTHTDNPSKARRGRASATPWNTAVNRNIHCLWSLKRRATACRYD